MLAQRGQGRAEKLTHVGKIELIRRVAGLSITTWWRRARLSRSEERASWVCLRSSLLPPALEKSGQGRLKYEISRQGRNKLFTECRPLLQKRFVLLPVVRQECEIVVGQGQVVLEVDVGRIIANGTPPSGLQDTLGRFLDGGTSAVAILTKREVTIDAVAKSRANVRLALKPSAVDLVLEREKTIAGKRSDDRPLA